MTRDQGLKNVTWVSNGRGLHTANHDHDHDHVKS